jgi:hypothetical protein
VATRTTETGARVAAVLGYLGSVAQAGDGTYSGAGHYYSLFVWIDLRAGKAGGTLFQFYSFDLVLKFIDQKITLINSQVAEYTARVLVTKLTEDATGTPFVKVVSVAGLLVSDGVKIVDDDVGTPVLTSTIVGFGGLTVQLADPATGFLVEKVARLVKVL